nr:unnamed protein product [Digitaria exilis]
MFSFTQIPFFPNSGEIRVQGLGFQGCRGAMLTTGLRGGPGQPAGLPAMAAVPGQRLWEEEERVGGEEISHPF